MSGGGKYINGLLFVDPKYNILRQLLQIYSGIMVTETDKESLMVRWSASALVTISQDERPALLVGMEWKRRRLRDDAQNNIIMGRNRSPWRSTC